MKNKRNVGFAYEKIAGVYLEQKGYEILEYNFYSRNGEIDIVARHGAYVVFVEVKYRADDSCGHPLDAVTIAKQTSICKCAMHYLNRKGLQDVPVRFDVVGILGEQISLVQNAFEFVR